MTKRIAQLTLLISVLILLASSVGCKTDLTGELESNKPPETHTVADTIIRQGDNRLNSQVHVRWWGDDPDGYVQGFEFRFDNGDWTFTTSNDSVFLLSPPPGNDTIDFTFEVRAIDNDGLRDETPARLDYPVKNSPPNATIVAGVYNPTTTYPAVKVSWQGSDPDGAENISHYEFVWNDTTQPLTQLEQFVNSATFVAQNPEATQSDFEYYINNEEEPESGLVSNISLNDTNRFYVRAVDNSGARSDFAGSSPVYIKQVQSDVLLVNAYVSGFEPVESFYTDQLNAIGINPLDTLRIFEQQNGVFVNRAADNLTQSRVFNLFDYILWFGSNASESLSLAQKTTGDFFNDGGKMMMSMYVSSTFDEQSQFLEFTPINALVSPPDTTLILNKEDTLTSPLANYPILESTSIVGVVKPIEPEIGAEVVYEAPLLARDKNNQLSEWNGTKSVMAIRRQGGTANFFISTLELQKLNGLDNMDELFQQVMVEEFGY